MKIGLTADWHIGSKLHLRKQLEEYLKTLYEEGVEDVYHAGDMVDGHRLYHGHEHYLKIIGAEDQVNEAAELIDRYKGKLKFYGVYGNHDLDFLKRAGAYALHDLERKTENFELISKKDGWGLTRGKHRFGNKLGRKNLELIHGASAAKTPGYSIETYLRELAKHDMKELPDILGYGHIHRYDPAEVYGCLGLLCGNFMKSNDYFIRKGFISPPGGWLLDIQKDRITPTKFIYKL